ncbi:hypothetical protein [Streptomyces sp. NPDC053069]|uniref:hypothetical protein n=1 Tax=Streptomyces sp. NPDC053069 TaxID=3365695 RepID=UPI0037D0CBA5
MLRQVPVSVEVSEGLSFTTEYSNCYYGTEVQPRTVETHHRALCLIDMQVAPGRSVDLAPVALKVGKRALRKDVAVRAATGMDWSGGEWRDIHRGRGGELTLAQRTAGVPPAARRTGGMSYGLLGVPVHNAWDLEVTGAALKGRKGETLTAHLSLDHHGADVAAQPDSENSVPFARVEVRFPEGVTVLSTPKLCGVPNSRKRTHYRCEYGLYTSGFEVPVLRDGFHVDYPFKMRIDDPSRLTGGMIRVDAPPERLRDDADPRNSTAPLTIEAAGAAGGFGPTAWAVAAGAAAAVLTGLLALGRRRRR